MQAACAGIIPVTFIAEVVNAGIEAHVLVDLPVTDQIEQGMTWHTEQCRRGIGQRRPRVIVGIAVGRHSLLAADEGAGQIQSPRFHRRIVAGTDDGLARQHGLEWNVLVASVAGFGGAAAQAHGPGRVDAFGMRTPLPVVQPCAQFEAVNPGVVAVLGLINGADMRRHPGKHGREHRAAVAGVGDEIVVFGVEQRCIQAHARRWLALQADLKSIAGFLFQVLIADQCVLIVGDIVAGQVP